MDQTGVDNPDYDTIVDITQMSNELDKKSQIIFEKIMNYLKPQVGSKSYNKLTVNEFEKLINFEIENDFDINYSDFYGNHYTILHNALSITNDPRYIKIILDQPIAIDKVDDQHNSYLMHAIINGNSINTIKMIIEKKININLQNNDGHSALMLALYNKPSKYSKKLIELLIRAGANVNLSSNNGSTALVIACIGSNKIDFVRLLVESGANVNLFNQHKLSAFDCALSDITSNYEVLKLLVSKGCDVNINNRTAYSQKNEHTMLTYLMVESIRGDVSKVKLFIDLGSNLNIQSNLGYTALMLSIENKHKEVAKLLIESGANVNLFNQNSLNAFDMALQDSKSNYEVLELLVDSGYNININDKLASKFSRLTNLMVASIDGDISKVKLFIDLGSDVNIQCSQGYTALMMAIENNHAEVVKLLLDAGADLYIQNSSFQNSIDILAMRPSSAINRIVDDHKIKLKIENQKNALSKIKHLDQTVIKTLQSRKQLTDQTYNNYFKKVYDDCHVDPDPLIYVNGSDFTEIALNEKPNSRLLGSVIKIGKNCYTAEYLYNWWKKQVDSRLPVVDPLTRLPLTDSDKKNIIDHMNKYNQYSISVNPDDIQIETVDSDIQLVSTPIISPNGLPFWNLKIVTPTITENLEYIPDYSGESTVNGAALISAIRQLWDNNRMLESVNPFVCCRIHLRKPISYWTDESMTEWADDIQIKIDSMMDEINSHR